jgi:hypothetical protein
MRAAPTPQDAGAFGAAGREALVVAMAVVPGIYARNRHFALHERADVRRARARAAQLRGIVRQLAGTHGQIEELALVRCDLAFELRYRVRAVRMERRALLSETEASCVAYLATRAGVSCLHATDEDRARIDAALRRLATGLRLAAVESGDIDERDVPECRPP